MAAREVLLQILDRDTAELTIDYLCGSKTSNKELFTHTVLAQLCELQAIRSNALHLYATDAAFPQSTFYPFRTCVREQRGHQRIYLWPACDYWYPLLGHVNTRVETPLLVNADSTLRIDESAGGKAKMYYRESEQRGPVHTHTVLTRAVDISFEDHFDDAVALLTNKPYHNHCMLQGNTCRTYYDTLHDRAPEKEWSAVRWLKRVWRVLTR